LVRVTFNLLQRFLFILIFILAAKLTIAQSISTLMGARAAGMGYASSGLADEWSIWNNPGGLGRAENFSVSSAYEIRPWMKGASRLAAAANAPTKFGTFGAGLFRFGDDLYSEQVISLGAGNKLGIASLGAKINIVQYRTAGIGTWHAVSFDLGGITQLTEKLFINAYIFNIGQAKINKDTDERLPTKLTAGITYRPSAAVIITSEIIKDLDFEPTWRTGLEYQFKENIFFRTGFNLQPSLAFFGMGAVRKRIKIDYALQVNSPAGPTHQASAIYRISKSDSP
jgi:hypothetical protein